MFNLSHLSIPAFPKSNPASLSEIESKCNLQSVYRSIDRAETLLRNATIPEQTKQRVPTERSLYMLYGSECDFTRSCPSRLLPYLHHHYETESSFDSFCCSLLNTDASGSTQVPPLMLIRGFIEEKETEDGIDDDELCEIEQMDSENKDVNEIEIEEVEEEEQHKTHFELFPTLSLWNESNSLNEDLTLFIHQIPAFRTYSKETYPVCSTS